MDQAIEEFVKEKRIAILGVSRSGKKFGNIVYTELKQRGYQPVIVHPEASEINGDRCYASLGELQGQVDSVLICLPPHKSAQALHDAAAVGLTKIWISQGADSPEVQAVARDLGLHPVTGKCILMYAQPVQGFHNFHRLFAKLIGQY